MILQLILLVSRRWPFARGRHFIFRNLKKLGLIDRISESVPSGFKCRQGFKILCTLEHDRVSDWLKVFGNYETGTDNYLLSKGRKDGLFLDVGSNIGYYALLLANCDRSREVWAFEPNPAPRGCMEDSLKLNDLEQQVRVFPYALSDADGTASFVFEEGISGSGHLGSGAGESLAVEIRAFNGLWEARGSPKVSVVKIDVEGHEWQVLVAMREMLQRDHPDLVVELVDEQLNRFGKVSHQIIEFLNDLGYSKVGDFELNTFFEAPVKQG